MGVESQYRRYYAMCMFVVIGCAALFPSVNSIECYMCSSSRDVHCTESIDVRTTNLRPTNCSYINNAGYCVKTTGLYKGEVGTTRFCSSENLGNLCDPQQRMGDVREYRSCIFTCSTTGCNSASTMTSSLAVFIIFLTILLITTT